MQKPQTLKIGELFCGAGGLARGLQTAVDNLNRDENTGLQIDHVWANDYELDACKSYTANFPATEVIHQDVRTLDIESLDPVDGFMFGFPCNDFSLAGKKKNLDGEFGPLFAYGAQVLETHQPEWFLAENVDGLRSNPEVFNHITGRFHDAGYRLTPHVYHFEKYGVPQRRHRIVIIGVREDQDWDFHVPHPSRYTKADVSIRHALEKPVSSDDPLAQAKPPSERVQEILSHIEPGQNMWTADIPPHLRHKTRGVKMSMIYKRPLPGEPAPTITASGGGGTSGYHYAENRALTNRERARIQTFPDTHVFVGGPQSVRKQIGMAVPPAGAAAILEALLKSRLAIPYPTIEANIE